jgi:hypothetical protein
MNLSLALSAPWLENTLFLAYRASAYLLVHVVDDAAMMAIVFC